MVSGTSHCHAQILQRIPGCAMQIQISGRFSEPHSMDNWHCLKLALVSLLSASHLLISMATQIAFEQHVQHRMLWKEAKKTGSSRFLPVEPNHRPHCLCQYEVQNLYCFQIACLMRLLRRASLSPLEWQACARALQAPSATSLLPHQIAQDSYLQIFLAADRHSE